MALAIEYYRGVGIHQMTSDGSSWFEADCPLKWHLTAESVEDLKKLIDDKESPDVSK